MGHKRSVLDDLESCPGLSSGVLGAPLDQAPDSSPALPRGYRVAAAPALLTLRAQVRARWPGRDERLDGIIRDPRIGPRSDHHLGNALDLTTQLGSELELLLVHELARQMRFNPRGGRLTYVIGDGQIASARTQWRWVRYTRSCPHRRHVHLSIRDDLRGVTRPWNLDRLPS